MFSLALQEKDIGDLQSRIFSTLFGNLTNQEPRQIWRIIAEVYRGRAPSGLNENTITSDWAKSFRIWVSRREHFTWLDFADGIKFSCSASYNRSVSGSTQHSV